MASSTGKAISVAIMELENIDRAYLDANGDMEREKIVFRLHCLAEELYRISNMVRRGE